MKRTPPDERFARFIGAPTGASACIPWTPAPRGHGYGLFNDGARIVQAHRFAYERAYGPIPTGYVLHHVCRCSVCVNPEHLVPMTPADHNRLHARLRREAA